MSVHKRLVKVVGVCFKVTDSAMGNAVYIFYSCNFSYPVILHLFYCMLTIGTFCIFVHTSSL